MRLNLWCTSEGPATPKTPVQDCTILKFSKIYIVTNDGNIAETAVICRL